MPHSSTFDDLASLDAPQLQSPITPTPSSAGISSTSAPAVTNPSKSFIQHSIREENIDKFATLFSPSTPHASPETDPIPLPNPTNELHQRPANHAHGTGRTQHHRAPSTSSQLSDFGAFVSVSALDDPLTSSLSAMEMEDFREEPLAESHNPAVMEAPDSLLDTSVYLDGDFSSQRQQPARPASRTSMATRSSSRSTSSQRFAGSNSTVNFFDQFASDARERSTATRNLVLDELLMHEDDPLYFLKQTNDDVKKLPDTPSTATTVIGTTPTPLSPVSPAPAPPPKSPHYTLTRPGAVLPFPPLIPRPPPSIEPSSSSSSSSSSAKTIGGASIHRPPLEAQNSYIDPAFDMQHDLDHDYFRTPSPADVPLPPPPHRTTPARSSSLLVPEARIAAPVTSPMGAVRSEDFSSVHAQSQEGLHKFAISPPQTTVARSEERSFDAQQEHYHDIDRGDGQGTSGPGILPIPLTRSESYSSSSGSLTALPTKWMSSLLRGHTGGGSQGQSVGHSRPTAESIFDHDASPSSSYPHSNSTHDQHGWRSSHPQHTQTLPNPTFLHTSAFAPVPAGYQGGSSMGGGSTMSVTSSPSPFAPHVYIPPSGAPGYAGETYGWDKGFSDELEAERRSENKSQPREGLSRDASASPSVQGSVVTGRSDSRGVSSASGSREGAARSKDTEAHREVNDHASITSSSSTGGGRWGSGFGFGFGSVRKSGISPSNSGDGSGAKTRSGDVRAASEGDPQSLGSGKTRGAGYGQQTSWGRPAYDDRGKNNGNGNGKRAEDREGERWDDNGMGDFIERKTGNVELVGRREASAPVLTPELAGKLRAHLPALSRLPKKWTLIYSLDQHGISLNTLYTRCEAHAIRKLAPGEITANKAAMLVVVKDGDGTIFGAWVAEGVRHNRGGKGYFGGGESFLWKYTNETLFVYKCTGKNNYIELCEPQYISFGGGDGHYGLYLDDTLFDGSSAPCPTFDNEPLCSPGLKKGASVAFECVGLEVWGMGQ